MRPDNQRQIFIRSPERHSLRKRGDQISGGGSDNLCPKKTSVIGVAHEFHEALCFITGTSHRVMRKRRAANTHRHAFFLRRLFADFPCIESVALELTKDNPPMGADCLGAGIAVTVSRADFE